MSKNPEPVRRAEQGLKPDPMALQPSEVAEIAVKARRIWSQQGEGTWTDSKGRVWSFGLASSTVKALRVTLGGNSQDVGQATLGITASEPLASVVAHLDSIYVHQQHQDSEQSSSNDARRTEKS